MDSFGRLANLQQVKDGDVRTYLATDPETGMQVLLHLRRTELLDREFNKKLRKWLEAAPTELLDKGEFNGLIYVVTELSGPWRSLTEIIYSFDKAKTPGMVTGARQTGSGSGPRDLSGEETQPFFEPEQMVPQVSAKLSEASIPIRSEPVEPRVEALSTEPASVEPGEFTRMFGLHEASDPVVPQTKVAEAPDDFARMFAAQSVEKPLDAVQVSSDAPPGEFTQLFGKPAAAIEERKEKPKMEHTAAAGEFTRIFASGPASTATGGKVPENYVDSSVGAVKPDKLADTDPEKTRLFTMPTTTVPPETNTRESGSFTQLFRSPTTPRVEPIGKSSSLYFDKGPYAGPGEREVDFRNLPIEPSRSSQASNAPPGEFTQMFGKPGSAPGYSAGQNVSTPVSGDAGATGLFNAGARSGTPQQSGLGESGPGEYTRMFGGAQSNGPGNSPSTPSTPIGTPASPEHKPSSNQTLILIVAFAVLLLLAVTLVLILIMRR